MTKLTDMDMLQDYEKDTRLAAIGFITMASDAQDPELKSTFLQAAESAMRSQRKFASLISQRGDRP